MDKAGQTNGVVKDPLSVVLQGRSVQRNVCDHLESIADQLGGPVDRELCRSVLQRLENDLPLYQLDEEVFFSVLCAQDENDRALAQFAELATSEHRTHEAYFFELAEPLGDIGAGGRLYNVHTVGYMLRCCFETLRRHLNWEDVVLVKRHIETVTEPSVRALAAGLARNRSARSLHLRLSD